MEKFRNKYRIPSARAPFWDYGRNAAYFLTICTQNHEHFFGEIVNGKMILNELGEQAEKYRYEIPVHFQFIKLDAFVVMPNHVHGILIIDKPRGNVVVNGDAGDDGDAGNRRDAINRVSTNTHSHPESKFVGGITGNKNPMIHENIPRIIRWYKGRCTFEMRKIHADFSWQSRYHDHIIRDDKALQNIRNYIINNPINWAQDKFRR